MKFIKYFSIVLGFLSIAACGDPENFFTPVVDVDLPPHKSKLVVFANFDAGSDSLVLHLTRSRSALDTVSRLLIIDDTVRLPSGGFYVNRTYVEGDTFRNAKIEMFRNEVLWGTFKPNKYGKYILRQKLPNDAATYRLRVEVAGYDAVEATQKMPTAAKLDSVRYTFQGAVVQDGPDTRKSNEFTYFFTDPIETGNHYYVQAAYIDTFFKQRSRFYPESLDKLSQSGFLSDKSFNNKAYSWRNYSDYSIFPTKGSIAEYTLLTTTSDLLQFIRSKELNDNARDNPFAEPVILYSNFKNGYGIFTLSSPSIWIKKY
jgi:hypothetical protein